MFAFRLALALGRWDVDGLIRELPVAALTEWMAYDRVEPILTGRVVVVEGAKARAQQFNLWRSRHQDAAEAEDFLPESLRGPRKSPEDVWTRIKGWAVANQRQ